MGFARVDVEAALTAKDGDVQQAADWLLVGGTAAAVDRTSLSSTGDAAAENSNVDGGLDQSSAFHGACRQESARRDSGAACGSVCLPVHAANSFLILLISPCLYTLCRCDCVHEAEWGSC